MWVHSLTDAYFKGHKLRSITLYVALYTACILFHVLVTIVICYRILAPGAVAYYNAYFGRGTGPILLDDLLCTGSEARLVDCTHDGIGNYDYCYRLHGEDAGVRCQPGE